MKKILFLWDPHRQDKIDDIQQNISLVSKIVILGPVEGTIDSIPIDQWNQILDLSFHNKIPLEILISGDPEYSNAVRSDIRMKYTNVTHWPLYWLTETLVRMAWHHNDQYNKSLGFDIKSDNPLPDVEYEYKFICMSKRPRLHRLILMDEFAKHGLIDNNAVVFRELYDRFDYIPKYWKQKVLLLDQTENKRFIQEALPKEYAGSFMQIVPESETEWFQLSEKTIVPLFFCKPFLSASCKNFHKRLQSYGFELYTELFDYSFDNEPRLEIRLEKLVENVVKYKNCTNIELKKCYNQVKDKLIYNRQLAWKIATDISQFPNIWNEIAVPNNSHLSNINPYNVNVRIQELLREKNESLS